jgi:hypothetical protein
MPIAIAKRFPNSQKQREKICRHPHQPVPARVVILTVAEFGFINVRNPPEISDAPNGNIVIVADGVNSFPGHVAALAIRPIQNATEP